MKRVAAVLVGLGMAAPAAAQSCSLLPSDENRMWIGARYASGAAAAMGGVEVGFDFQGRVHLGGGLAFGGYDTGDGGASGRSGTLGFPLAFGPVHTCPTAFAAGAGYSFRDRFDADRGRVTDFRAGLRLPVAGPPLRLADTEVRMLGSLDVAWRHREATARTTVVDDTQVRLERDSRVDDDAVVEGLIGARLRAGSLGLTLGVASRVLDRRRLLPFVQVGVRIG